MRNDLLIFAIIATVEAVLFAALAIAHNSAVMGMMVGVTIPEIIRYITDKTDINNEQ